MSEAGWYPDPERPGELRDWDGTAWTEYEPTAEELARVEKNGARFLPALRSALESAA